MKFVMFGICIIVSSTLLSQSPEQKYLLRWKLDSAEHIVYEGGFETIEVNEELYLDHFEAFIQSTGLDDDIDFAGLMAEFVEASKEEVSKYQDFFVISSRMNKPYIRMIRVLKEGEKERKSDDLINIPTGVVLRASLDRNGAIHSQYLKGPQKNFVAIFFQLPTDSIAIGDQWDVDLQWITLDQNFICDSAYQNHQVTLVDVTHDNGDTIASLKYEMEEHYSGTMIMPWSGEQTATECHFTYFGICTFNITNGEWKSYDALNATNMTGFQITNQKSRYYLKQASLNPKLKEFLSEE